MLEREDVELGPWGRRLLLAPEPELELVVARRRWGLALCPGREDGRRRQPLLVLGHPGVGQRRRQRVLARRGLGRMRA